MAECVRGLTFRACVGDRPGRAGQGVIDVRQYILLLLLLRHNIMKKMGKKSQGVALGWLEDQVRAPGEFIDAAHIDEKLSKRCVERRRM